MSDLTKTQVVKRSESALLPGGDADAILADIGKAFRRVESTSRTDKTGMRAVWHQSKLRTDMLSWERTDRSIERQELCFFGKMVEFREGNGLRTGVVPDEIDDGKGPRVSRSELFQPGRALDVSVLDAASRILRASKRDYYTQHLLGHVTTALQRLEQQPMRTQIQSLDFFRRIEQQSVAVHTGPMKVPRTTRMVWAILGGALLLAFALFWLFFTRAA